MALSSVVNVNTNASGSYILDEMQPIYSWTQGIFVRSTDETIYQSRIAQFSTSEEWQLFQRRVAIWRKERAAMSSLNQIYMCYSYQQIIAMGERALPFIFSELRGNHTKPEPWFWALPRNNRGESSKREKIVAIFLRMAESWLAWS